MTVSRRIIACALACLLAGCAATAPERGTVNRLSAEELARLTPAPNPTVPLTRLLALVKAGTPPASIIAELQATGTYYNLDAAQIVDLARQGVDQSVIDHLVGAQERARQATLLTQLADRDAQAARAIELERARRLALQRRHDPFFDPFWPHPYYGWSPRGGWTWGVHGGFGPYRRRW